MRKTFCDRCGEQCLNLTAHLHGEVIHHTNQGEQVGYDGIRPIDLCKSCYQRVKDMLGLTEIPEERDSDMAMVRAPDTITAVIG